MNRRTRISLRLAALLSLVVLTAMAASTASAHAMPGLDVSKAPPARTSFDRQEVASLGTQHAAEHRLIRAEQRWIRHLSKRQLRKLVANDHQVYKAALKLAAPSNVDGSWEPPFRIPNYAMHAALMPTGKVLFYGWPKDYSVAPNGGSGTRDARNFGTAWLWDPTAGTGPGAFKDVPPPMSDVNGGGAIDDNPTTTHLTDPASTQLRPAPIYCSGFAWLGNGTLVVMGGNRVLIPNEEGTRLVFTFDPFTETWHRQQSMERGRWYPSVVELPDGRVATFSGWTENGNAIKNPGVYPNGQMNDDIDVFPTTPVQYGAAGRAAENLGVAKVGTLPTEYYPHTRLLNSGRISVTGPGGQPSLSGPLTDLSTWDSTLPYLPVNNGVGNTGLSSARGGGNAVLLPNGTLGPDTVMLLGGYYYAATAGKNFGATAAIKMTPGQGGWTNDSLQHVGRAQQNTVLLPTGAMVTIGGAAGYRGLAGNNAEGESKLRWPGDGPLDGVNQDFVEGLPLREQILRVELYDPASHTWTLGPPQQHFRTYHSVGLLLPDGRVISAGDEMHEDIYRLAGGNPDPSVWIGDAEIYSPPYLFGGARPTIRLAPLAVQHDQTFDVTTPDAATVDRAVVMMPSAVTHGNDMTQRHVDLAIVSKGDGTLTLRAPANGSVAPPGYYMLFLLRGGVPSTAKFMRIGPAADAEPAQIAAQYAPFDTTPPSAPSNLRVTATTTTSIALGWDASSDAGGVQSYRVKRAGVADGTTTGTSTTITGLAPGSKYTFTVTALDNAGNESAASASLTAATTAKASLTLILRTISRGDLVRRGKLVVGLRVSRPTTLKLVARAGKRPLTKVVSFRFKTSGLKKVTLLLTPAARTWLRSATGPVTITIVPIGLSAASWKTISSKRTLHR